MWFCSFAATSDDGYFVVSEMMDTAHLGQILDGRRVSVGPVGEME